MKRWFCYWKSFSLHHYLLWNTVFTCFLSLRILITGRKSSFDVRAASNVLTAFTMTNSWLQDLGCKQTAVDFNHWVTYWISFWMGFHECSSCDKANTNTVIQLTFWRKLKDCHSHVVGTSWMCVHGSHSVHLRYGCLFIPFYKMIINFKLFKTFLLGMSQTRY